MPAAKKKTKTLTLAGRPPTEVVAIIAAIAAGVIVLAIFAEWLISGKGLFAQRRADGDADGE